MNFEEILKFNLKRVSPFQGLVIDSDTWRDAHEYHHNQQRLHTLAFHDTGILHGLEILANKTPDLSITINPGIAVDPKGNIIIVPETQNYRIQTHEKRTIYLIIQFREVPGEPFQPPEGGQPTRIIEAYRIQERDKLPDEPYIELCRIKFDPADKTIRNTRNPSQIGQNEIDLGYRKEVKPGDKQVVERIVTQVQPAPSIKSEPAAATAPPPPVQIQAPTKETIDIGYAVLGGASSSLHATGIKNLVREINRLGEFTVTLSENINIDNKIKRFALIYITGNSQFELNTDQQSALAEFLRSGGVIFGEACGESSQENAAKGAKEFGLSFNQAANKLNCKLEVIQRSHKLLSACHIFSGVPAGTETAMLLEGGNMIYSASDYGCAWQGGYSDKPLSRENIRNSLEIGTNIIYYAQQMKSKKE